MIDRAEILRRYSDALSRQRYPQDLALVSQRYKTNHRIPEGDAIVPDLNRIFSAHAARVAGNGSPRECEEALADVLRSRAA